MVVVEAVKTMVVVQKDTTELLRLRFPDRHFLGPRVCFSALSEVTSQQPPHERASSAAA
ncbi:hypothetical protein VSS74_01620 [Conexibacter stalactiti]|uniref:Uncharacterized protein n=1 Tax=Conexibacter stalactiti TaxID=1940611 RepID=A0ABU4HK00_9ACTN|nr:hypothetical protein [Conexibacter stalactiti]MDW5593017.1 hypothetical protein [Conexibacter stalactiti]MEC5033658.1 hypothetical protein [Conexibacter stalactiti]